MRSFLSVRVIRFFFGEAFIVAPASVLLLFSVLFVGGPAFAATPCPAAPGTGADIVVDQECHLGDGTYNYGNVNIVGPTGSLIFDEKVQGVTINFFAKGILIENGGSLIAGSTAPARRRPGDRLPIRIDEGDAYNSSLWSRSTQAASASGPRPLGHGRWNSMQVASQRRRALRHSQRPLGLKGKTAQYKMPGGNIGLFLSL